MDTAEALEQTADNTICRKGGMHSGLPIVMVCMEKECVRNRLCCLTCVDDLHCKHELISLKKFENYISTTLNHNVTVNNRQAMLGLIKQTRQTYKRKIDNLRSHFLAKVDETIERVQEHFQRIEDTFGGQKFENVGGQLIEEFTEEKINHFLQLAKQAENNLVKSINEINDAVNASQKLLDDRMSSYYKQIDRNTDLVVKTIDNFKITGKNAIKLFYFNPNTKAASLTLGNNSRTAKRGEGAGGYPIAVVDQPFTETNNEVNFSIMEEPANKACWMGVCVLDIVKNLNFQSCYGMGKGTWAIDQVGQNHASAYSWSHHDPNFNSAPKVGFQFAVGDIINIRVDFQKSIAIYTKNSTVSYEQPIKLDLGAIYAFAGPTNLNDVIAIL